MSIIRADSIKNRAGNGAPDFPNGITVTGIVTSTVLDASVTNLTVTGNLGVGGTVTYEDVSNVDSVGVITARDGLRVTGIATATEYEVVNAGNTPIFRFRGSSNNEIGKIDADAISGTTSQLRLYTENGGNIGERLRIGPAGQIGVGGANYGTSGQFLQSQGSSSAVQWATVSAVVKKIHSFEFATRTAGSGSANNNQFTWTSSFVPLDPDNNSFMIDGSVAVNLDGNDYCGFGLRFEKSGGGVTDFNGYGVQHVDTAQAHMSFYGYAFTTSSSFSGAGTYTIFHRAYGSSSNPNHYAINSSDDSRITAQTRGFLTIIEYKN